MTTRFVLPRREHISWRIIEVPELEPTSQGLWNRLLKLKHGKLGVYARDLYSFLLASRVAELLEFQEQIEVEIPPELLVRLGKLARRRSVKIRVRRLK